MTDEKLEEIAEFYNAVQLTAGALETLKTTILVLAMQSRANFDAQKLDAIGNLDTNLRDCCNKITKEQILENETIFRPTTDRQTN